MKKNSFDYWFDRLQAIIKLIKAESTGTATELATQLGISRRAVFRYLDVLRERYTDVHYCKKRKTYYFEGEVILLSGLLE